MVASSTLAEAAVLRGLVTDASGHPLPGASIELKDGGLSRSTLSGVAGDYLFRDVPPGTYLVSFKLPSCATTLKKDVMLDEGAAAVVDATSIWRFPRPCWSPRGGRFATWRTSTRP